MNDFADAGKTNPIKPNFKRGFLFCSHSGNLADSTTLFQQNYRSLSTSLKFLYCSFWSHT